MQKLTVVKRSVKEAEAAPSRPLAAKAAEGAEVQSPEKENQGLTNG